MAYALFDFDLKILTSVLATGLLKGPFGIMLTYSYNHPVRGLCEKPSKPTASAQTVYI